MQSDVSFERRFRYQEMAIARLMCEARLLRDENARLAAKLEATRKSGPVAKVDRLEATLPAGPVAPATARAALTLWLSGQIPGDALSDARLLASELVAHSGSAEVSENGGSLRFAVRLRDGALRVDVRDPTRSASPSWGHGGNGLGLKLVEALARRWGVEDADGAHLWFEVDAARVAD